MTQLSKPKNSTRWFSKGELYQLLGVAAFPVHAWAIFLILQDVSWITERTNQWDAFGVASYGLVFAFIESLLYFGFGLLLSVLIPRNWKPSRKLAILSAILFILGLGGIAGQYFFVAKMQTPQFLINAAVNVGRPLWVLAPAVMLVVLPIVILPIYGIMRSDKAVKFTNGLVERIAVLSTLYFLFDFIGLIIAVVRNLPA